ncbi:hypothetical protein Purlil1_5995 [Purpureocillium lilacinum]|uniref:Uncharacterized protein n=1 Tax=Purpureocillium lilacinum TaxID=33203 RepID=A0ABR0C137_PURLI|nr:hypothetical protein Purlil1_5995 [Purpureocillium lilacinum]
MQVVAHDADGDASFVPFVRPVVGVLVHAFLRQLRRQGHKATNGRGRPPPVAPRSLALTSPSTARPLDSAVALLCGAAAAIVIVPCIGSSFCEVPSTPSVQPPTRLASTGEQAHPSISTQHRRTHLPPKRGKQFSWVAPSTPTRSTSRSLSSARGDALAQRQGTTRHTSSTENSSRLGSLSIEKERDKAATRCAADPGRQSRADRARDINALMTMFLRLPFVPRLVGHGSPVDLAIGILGLKHVDLCRLRIQEQETPAGRPFPRYAELRLLRLCIERLEARGADEWCCWPRHGRADVRLTAAPRRVQLALVLHAVREVRGTESFALGALTLGHTAELDFVTCDASHDRRARRPLVDGKAQRFVQAPLSKGWDHPQREVERRVRAALAVGGPGQPTEPQPTRRRIDMSPVSWLFLPGSVARQRRLRAGQGTPRCITAQRRTAPGPAHSPPVVKLIVPGRAGDDVRLD